VALVGYTNAGKSTLLNALSGADVLVEDKLFATLDPVMRQVELPENRRCLVVDTVGFIRKLPHQLVQAFRSTLEEALFADLLVVVSDLSSPNYAQQRSTVFEVLNDLDEKSIAKAKYMVEAEKVSVGIADTPLKLYVKATVIDACGNSAYAVIENDHDNIVETAFGDTVLTSARKEETCHEQKTTLDYKLTVKEIFEFASTVAYEDIAFILESRTLNLALAEEGMRGQYGLRVGQAISASANKEVFGGDFLSYAMALTAAASDARMAGCTLAAMSNSGSGNQGITVTMPVIAYSIKYGTTDEQLARALVLSHLVAIHIKGYLGKLSALCGCVIASTGSSCGLVYLRGGDYEQVCSAIKNMIGNITGMVCDGAKVGCAMKVASGVSSALQSAVLAREGMCISEHDGIIEKDIEKTIQNLGKIGSVGMQHTDDMILDIMVCK
jgi:L-cysteine desulfidase